MKKENESSNSDEQGVNNLEKKGVNVPKIEDDERLLSEVEAEMARGVAIPAKISSAQQTTPITGPVIPITQSSSLEVVEEKDEAIVGRLEDLEENVDRLNQIIRDTELCLQQVKYLRFLAKLGSLLISNTIKFMFNQTFKQYLLCN